MTSQPVASDAGRALRSSSDKQTLEFAASALSQYSARSQHSLRELATGTCRYTGTQNQGNLLVEWQAHQARSARGRIVALATARGIGPRYLPKH